MTIVPEEIVEQTWREMATFEPRMARRAVKKVQSKQPALLAYVMAETEDARSEVQELAVYLFFVVVRMFERLPRHRVKRLSPERVERAVYATEAHFARLQSAHDRFVESAAKRLAERQPHVLRYLAEAILEESDPDLNLTEHESGLVFMVLKTVVDLLDQATKPQR